MTTMEQAREAIAGNLCRCTGYQNIVAAVLRAGELIEVDYEPLPAVVTPQQALEGNLCRCTGYQNIVRAVLAAASGDVASGHQVTEEATA